MLPTDAKLVADKGFDPPLPALALNKVVQALEPARRLRLIVIDAPATLPGVQLRPDNRLVRNLRQTAAKSGRTLVAFAVSAHEIAGGGQLDPGLFTRAILDQLAIPGADVDLALSRAADQVWTRSGHGEQAIIVGAGVEDGMSVLAELSPAPVMPAAAARFAHESAIDMQGRLARQHTNLSSELQRVAQAKAAVASLESTELEQTQQLTAEPGAVAGFAENLPANKLAQAGGPVGAAMSDATEAPRRDDDAARPTIAPEPAALEFRSSRAPSGKAGSTTSTILRNACKPLCGVWAAAQNSP